MQPPDHPQAQRPADTQAARSGVIPLTPPAEARALDDQDTTPPLSVQGQVIYDAEDARRLRETWHEMAGLMKNKHGFVAADLNPRAVGSDPWIEISRWEYVAHEGL